jgi:vanillate O-demethylase ferredoxin subunit
MTSETIDVVVRRREMQGPSVVVLDLAPAAGRSLPAFEAGAHVDLHLGDGLVRQYSLCGDPADATRYRVGVLRDPASRGGSEAVHSRLVEGAVLRIGVPRNHFPLAMDARHSILVGGGIGVTPMLAMAHALHRAGRSFELHYCARSRSRSGFLHELESAPFADRVRYHFSEEGDDQRVDAAALIAAAGTAGTHLYVCGPNGFMESAMAAASAAGLEPARIHREYFNAEVDTSGEGFEVVAAASGKSVRVADGQTIVAALKSIGIRIEVSCEEGVCGTCVCTVLDGECDHRDVYLTDEEKADGDQIMACCSRAKSPRLVLDI